MTERTPLIDQRNANDIAAQVKDLLRIYFPRWDQDDRAGNALIAVFARFSELIIERLNQVPEKNFLAYLEFLGLSQLPPQPARVPLTFILAEGAVDDIAIPAGTQVAAEPSPGEQQPVVFETETDMVATSAGLRCMYARDAKADRYADLKRLLDPAVMGGKPFLFNDSLNIAHDVYIGNRPILSCQQIQALTLTLNLAAQSDPLTLQWELWDGGLGIKLEPDSGAAPFKGDKNYSITFKRPPFFPEIEWESRPSFWLRCRLISPITPQLKLPDIDAISLKLNSLPMPLDAAYWNTQQLEVSKEFFPFGEKPMLGDCFYLAQHEVFSRVGATATLSFVVIDPQLYIQEESGVRKITMPLDNVLPDLVWEYWDGIQWQTLQTTSNVNPSLTKKGSSKVIFTVPDIKPVLVGGLENYWIRVRINKYNYGVEGGLAPVITDKGVLERDEKNLIKYSFTTTTLTPPQLTAVSLQFEQTDIPGDIITVNDFVPAKVVKEAGKFNRFQPFQRSLESVPAIYMGMDLPDGRAVFPVSPIAIYFSVAISEYQFASANAQSSSPRQLDWEYWDGAQWAKASVKDETQALSRSGLVTWLPEGDCKPRPDFGVTSYYWLRVLIKAGDAPQLQRVLLNTMLASQTITIRNDILGSSNESKAQRFRATHAPILPGQQLEIQETEVPTAEELQLILREEGRGAISPADGASSRNAVWVRWHEVQDFHASGSRDRHYVVDRLSGEIRFGDGGNGLIPPRGAGNIRLSYYQTGGGEAGNKPAGAVNQLQSTLPYIDAVVNYEPALGGADAEDRKTMLERGPKLIRHHHRAVTIEDFEDMALLASPKVARALCVPLLNIENSPLENLFVDADKKQISGAGQVGVIIVPSSAKPKPVPDLELIQTVRGFLTRYATATATVSVAGPLYLSVSIAVEVFLKRPETALLMESLCRQKLTAFLHPLTGGQAGKGWPFGEYPRESDIYRIISEIDAIDHVSALTLKLGDLEIPTLLEDKVNQIKDTRRFLIYSGLHTVTCRYGLQ